MTTVFISYSHDSNGHKKRVLKIADQLMGQGVDCVFDQYEESPKEGWPKWMMKGIESSDFVLMFATKQYFLKSRGDVKSGVGKGTKFESLLTIQDLYDNDSENDFILPIVMNSTDTKYIPKPLKPFNYYNLEDKNGYEELYRRLTSQPKVKKPKLGNKRRLATGVNIDGAVPKDSDKKILESLGSNMTNSIIEITIDRDFDTYTKKDQEQLLSAVSNLLKIKDSEVKIKGVAKGSVIVYLEIPSHIVEELKRLNSSKELIRFGVTRIREIRSQNQFSNTKYLTTDRTRSNFDTQFDLKIISSNKKGIARVEEPAVTQWSKTQKVMTGTGVVKWFNQGKGFGFIKDEDSGHDVFVHFSNIDMKGYQSLTEGQEVEYEIKQDGTKHEAINVKGISESDSND